MVAVLFLMSLPLIVFMCSLVAHVHKCTTGGFVLAEDETPDVHPRSSVHHREATARLRAADIA